MKTRATHFLKYSLREHGLFQAKDTNRASFLSSRRGSATVEAVMLTPVFLCAVCCLISIGQLLLVEGEILYTLSQTLTVCAEDVTMEEYGYGTASGGAHVRSTFRSLFDESSLCRNMIAGGGDGIALSLDREGDFEDSIRIRASYVLRVPLPLASRFRFRREISLSRKLPTGFVVHGGNEEEDDRIVYVAEHGTVYHTHMDCSHICIRISDAALIEGVMASSSLKPCEHCALGRGKPSMIYITATGDCYHTSLSCSGLKRTVKAVPLSKVKGMRKCSRCAGRDQ